MIEWMSEKCDRLMEEYGISAIGFDPEREENAEVILEFYGEQTERPAVLGDVRNLDSVGIERRFAAAVLHVGIREDIPALVEFADRMLDPSDNGEGERVPL